MQKQKAEGIKNARRTSQNGSAWSTEKKYMRRYKGTFDIFFAVEHRMRKEEMEEQFNKEAKQGWRLAGDAARITDENARSEDHKHTSEGVFVAVDSNLRADIGKKKKEQLSQSQATREELPNHG